LKEITMKKTLTAASILLATLALTACNTWEGAKQDARVVGDKTVEGGKKAGRAVGTGLEKAGEGLGTAGEAVKEKSE
jgi:predicted small secreted protein